MIRNLLAKKNRICTIPMKCCDFRFPSGFSFLQDFCSITPSSGRSGTTGLSNTLPSLLRGAHRAPACNGFSMRHSPPSAALIFEQLFPENPHQESQARIDDLRISHGTDASFAFVRGRSISKSHDHCCWESPRSCTVFSTDTGSSCFNTNPPFVLS